MKSRSEDRSLSCTDIEVYENGFYVVLDDGTLNQYNNSMKLINSIQLGQGKDPSDISYSNQRDELAIAYTSSDDNVDIYNGSDLTYNYSIPKSNNTLYLQWTNEPGGILYGGGFFRRDLEQGGKEYALVRWTDPENDDRSYIIVGSDTISVLHKGPDNSVIFGTDRPEWGVVKEESLLFSHKAENLHFTYNDDRVIFAMPVGTDLAALSEDGKAYRFNLIDRQLTDSGDFEAFPPMHEFRGRSIEIGSTTSINGKIIERFDVAIVRQTYAGSLLYDSTDILWSLLCSA